MFSKYIRYMKALSWGFLEGLFPWIGIAVATSMIVDYTSFDIKLQEHEAVAASISSVLGLLNAFLVTTNIGIAGKISFQIRELQGCCVECALLCRTSFHGGFERTAAYEIIKCVLDAATDPASRAPKDLNKKIQNFISALIPASSKTHGLAPPTMVAIVKSVNNVSSQYGKLSTLRASSTPPAIETLVYTLGVMNLMLVLGSVRDVGLDISVMVAAFVASSSLGLLGISNVIKDPLDRLWLADAILEAVRTTDEETRCILTRSLHR